MAKTEKKRMSEQDMKDWDDLYQYVKKILGYDQNQSLSKEMVLRLKGLLTNKFMENNKIADSANYSYLTVLNTFKFCSLDIQKGLQGNSFQDERHRFNYVIKIVESNINNVYTRMKNSEKSEEKIETIDFGVATHSGASYQTKTQKTPNRLKEYW